MFRIRNLLIALIVVCSFTIGAQSAFASLSYIDGNEVWVMSDDGSRKVRLSAGEGDWRQAAQSDSGFVVGVRKEAGKISQVASFTVWNPSGQIVHFGSLSGHIDSPKLNVYPTSLDITPSGGNIAYGYQRAYGQISGGGLAYGTYLKVSADATVAVPTSFSTADGTFVGTRLVGHQDGGSAVAVQSTVDGNVFDPWIGFPLGDPAYPGYGLDVDRTDVAATGTVTATELRDDTFYTKKINLGKWTGLQGTYVDDCMLPTAGDPSDITISQDGATIAWQDSRGIVIAGAPDFSGPSTCNLTRAPAVLSASGTWPSYGPFNVSAAPGGGGSAAKPKVSVSSSIKLSDALKSGFKISVTSATGGSAKVTLSVKPSVVGKKGKKAITIATGKAKLTASKKKTIKVKFTSTGKKLKKKLKGKKATLTVTVGAAITTKTVKLK